MSPAGADVSAQHGGRTRFTTGLPPRVLVALVIVLGIGGVLLARDHFELRKLLGAALTPIGVVWMVLASLGVVLWRRHQRGLATIAAAAWMLLSLAGNPHLAARQLAQLERAVATPTHTGRLDAVLVLGGAIQVSPRGRVRFADAVDRLLHPVRLYHRGQIGTLVTSGPFVPPRPAQPVVASYFPLAAGAAIPSYPQAVAEFWADLGVKPAHILLLEGPRTTREEIEAWRSLAAERGWRRLGLVSSAWHLPRALRHCRRLGLEVVPIPCDARGEPPRWRWRQLVPSPAALETTALAWHEVLAVLAGR